MSSSSTKHHAQLRVVVRSFDIAAASSSSDIFWDDRHATHDQLKCVVIGKLTSESCTLAQKHWVIVLKELSAGLHERVGADSLPKDKIAQGSKDIDFSVV
jgi:hypothetical protein